MSRWHRAGTEKNQLVDIEVRAAAQQSPTTAVCRWLSSAPRAPGTLVGGIESAPGRSSNSARS